MIRKRALLLLIALLILGASYYLSMYSRSSAYVKGFLNANPEEVSAISILNKENEYRFLIKDGIWYSDNSLNATIDNYLFKLFIKKLAQLPVTQIIQEHSENLESFGLEHPEVQIKVSYNNSRRDDCLLLGNENAANTSTYAKLKESRRVVLLGIILKEDVRRILEKVSGQGMRLR